LALEEIKHNSKKIIIRIYLVDQNGTRMVKVDEDNVTLGLPTFLILIFNIIPLSQHFIGKNKTQW